MQDPIQTNENDRPKRRKTTGFVLAGLLIFVLMGASIFAIATKTYEDMSDGAIANLNENLNLIKSAIEIIFENEASFEKITAQELADINDPDAIVSAIPSDDSATLVSFVPAGSDYGFSNDGKRFDPSGLDFSRGENVAGLEISQSYVSSMGSWAYTMACPVEKDGKNIGTLYMEYDYDAIDEALPRSFFDDHAVLYLMDSATERFVLKPEGMGEREAGHINLEDFFRANSIDSDQVLEMVNSGIEERRNVMFMHKVQGRDSLCFLWSINDGATYLVGYVPMEAIQKEAHAVNIALVLVTSVTALAFILCVAIFLFSYRRQTIARRAREVERAKHAEQLSQALQAAQLANESKSAFLANMSHDIRTPMNAVLGFAGIIAREADDPAKVRDYSSKITSSGKHLLDLINDVLDISKIESGKATLNLEEFDLGDSLAAAEAIISPMAANKGQTFTTEIKSITHERVIGDETHLNQILINLLSNAVKYTQENGHIWLRFIGLPQRSEKRERIRIEVEDDGFGMSEEFLQTIFDAFTRAENSTTNKVQGTGLGMSITKSLVDLMGGSIGVKSEEGKGSIFTVDLELSIPEEDALGYFWERAGIDRILVVDPGRTAFGMIRNFMEGTGVAVDTATSLADAMELIGKSRYKVILYACETFDDKALEETGAIRAKDADAIIIFVQNRACDMENAPSLPDNSAILTRPFFPSMLKSKVSDVMGLAGVDEEDAAGLDKILEGKSFLAAEDNFLNASILTEILQLEGAQVEIVENGRLALDRFTDSKPGEFDAILMDVQMPVMNGHEATRAIRDLDREDSKTIPIFAMTADAFAEDEQAALEAGMNAHIAKPLEIDDLKRAVDRFVEKG